ncbi:unnamed protein product [Schistocephalus solidus]|uniref:Uncharacterized protein n=2 Tax=Schistocephalus solidus TaxID=70667 RepID=A0A183SN11_SCHSO|nr:unnamed protein product [Schistocephalus solidus]
MPFLRVAGPCHLFAKALNAFAQNLGTSRLPRERESRVDTSRTNSRLLPTPAFQNKRMGVGGAFSPISSTLLWGIQSRAAEEYRMASLAAYSVIFGSTGPAYNSGDAEINSRQQYQQRGPGRISETVMLLRGADTVSLHSGVYLLSVEDESPRVRSLALEASKTHRSNLGLSRAKFRSTNSIITE